MFSSSQSTVACGYRPMITRSASLYSASVAIASIEPSASACSSSHCAAESTSGSCGRSTPSSAAISVATISRRPIARQGPKFKTGGMFSFSQTARSFGPAYLAASGVMSPQFSIPPEEHPAVRTRMSREISSFVSSTLKTSCPPAVRLEHPTTPARPLISPDASSSISGVHFPPRKDFKEPSLTPVNVWSFPCSSMRCNATLPRRSL